MRMIDALLPYNPLLEQRDPKTIRMIVLHCTELPDLKQTREYGEKVLYSDGTGNSGHYYIDRDGAVYRYVQDDRIARHVIGHNRESVGIELINSGRFPNWFHSTSQEPNEPYPDTQIRALKELLLHLRQQYPAITQLVRHSDLDTTMVTAEDDPSKEIHRKIDPGPLFPWGEIMQWWNTL